MFFVSNPAQLMFCAYGTVLNNQGAEFALHCLHKNKDTCGGASNDGCVWIEHADATPKAKATWKEGSCHLPKFMSEGRGAQTLEVVASEIEDANIGEAGKFKDHIPCLKKTFSECSDGCKWCEDIPEALGLKNSNAQALTRLCVGVNSDLFCGMLQKPMLPCPTETGGTGTLSGGVAASLLLVIVSTGFPLF